MRGLGRRIRGAIGNALVWGATWFGASFTFLAGAHLFGDFLPMADPWQLIFLIALNNGASGFLTGTVFSAYLGVAYRNKPLLGISKTRAALGGAAIAAAGSVAVTLATFSMAGMPLLITPVGFSGLMAAVYGGLTAAGTIALAQRVERLDTGRAEQALAAEQEGVSALLEG